MKIGASTRVRRSGGVVYGEVATNDVEEGSLMQRPKQLIRPKIGVALAGIIASATVVPYASIATVGSVVVGGAGAVYTAHSITTSISNVEKIAVKASDSFQTLAQSDAVKGSTDLVQYIGPTLQSGLHIAKQMETSELLIRLGEFDFGKLSNLLGKIGDSDIQKLINAIGEIVEKVDRLRIHNDVSITTEALVRDVPSNVRINATGRTKAG
jgi:hypothetical protein